MATGEFQWNDAVGVGIALLAGLLFAVALKGYVRTRTTRVLLFSAAFGVLFLKGVLKLAEAFLIGEGPVVDSIEILMDFAVLALFFLGMTRA